MYTTEKQAPGRLTGRKRSGRRWLLIPALCAVLILAVVLIVELGKSPRCCPPKRLPRRFPRESLRSRSLLPKPIPEPVPSF